MFATIIFYKGILLSVEAPNFVRLLITECKPSIKGNTAIVETGVAVMVPMFIEEGQTIRINTKTGEYIERV